MLFLLLLFSSSVYAAEQPMAKWVQYTKKDGLSHDMINDLVADDNGLLWIALGNAIFCYDGKTFSTPRLADFPYSNIEHVYKDDLGKIWIQGTVGDLAWYNVEKKVFQIYAHNDIVKSLTQGNQVESLSIRADGSLYFGSQGKGYFYVSPEGKVVEIIGKNSSYHGYLIIDQDDELPLIASIFDSTQLSTPFQVYFLNPDLTLNYQFEIPDQYFDCLPSLVQKADSNFLFSTGTSTLIELNRQGLIQIHQHQVSINQLLVDQKGSLWMGSKQQGVFHYPHADLNTPYQYLNHQVEALPLYEDDQGGIWLGTKNSGLYHIPHPYYHSYSSTRGPINPDNRVPSITSDGQQIFFGTYDNYLGSFRPDAVQPIEYFSSKPYPYPLTCILYDPIFQQLWVGTKDGATLFDRDQYTVTRPAGALGEQREHCRFIKETAQDSVLCFIMQTHYLLVKNQEIIYQSKSFSTPIYDVVHLPDGRRWVSCYDQTWAYQEEEWVSLNQRFPDLAVEPSRLLFHDHRLWIAPIGRNLMILNGDQLSEVNYDGEPIRNVRSIFKDEQGIIRASAPIGYIEFQTDQDGVLIEPRITTQDFNIVSADYWTGTTLNGKYYAGTMDGIYSFDQSSALFPEIQYPELAIQRIAINNKDTALLSDYQLSYDQNFIEIDFTGISYHSTIYMKTNLKYRMLGLDTIWRSANKRSLNFTTLPPGDYRLQIKAGLGTHHFASPQSIRFNISPPIWQTGWFRLLSLLLLASLGYVFFLYRSRQITKRERMKSEVALALERLELRALKAQINPHFIFNSISSVQYYLAKNDPLRAESYLQRFAVLMRKILENSENNRVLLADEIDLMKHYISLESERFQGEGIQLSVDFDEIEPQEVLIPPILFQPYIENAIWHGLKRKEGKRKIMIRAKKSDEQLQLEIEDNGIGRNASGTFQPNPKTGKRSFGMMISSRRIELLSKNQGENVQVKDLSDPAGNASGTLVILHIPYQTIPTYESVNIG